MWCLTGLRLKKKQQLSFCKTGITLGALATCEYTWSPQNAKNFALKMVEMWDLRIKPFAPHHVMYKGAF